ncbi:MAG TPA: dolichyl-phosphate beta-glucosyltransferase [Nitrospira sp.]|nr:dolichyl-phosphate beta-glucosyltransferase [Nitrospira sp.]
MFGRLNADSIELSIVIPAHNEAGRILPYLQQITEYFEQQDRPYEVLVVDDGSTDATAATVEAFGRSVPAVQLLRLPVCRGKGAAVRHGMQSAAGCLQLFTDADGATPIQEFARLEKALAGGADVAIGSRALAARSPGFAVEARLYRSVLGFLFNAAVQQIGIRGISDTQCGFKLFRRVVAQDLFGYSSIDGFGFDLELLYVAQQRGYLIAEVPVNWSDQPGSKVRVFRDGLAMLRELTVIRQNDSKGRYSTSSIVPEFVPLGMSRFEFPRR